MAGSRKYAENLVIVNGRAVYKFDNGYGASVICNPGSYGYDQGLMELAVIVFCGNGYDLTYDTPITYDVIGYLDENGVDEVLGAISRLDENGNLKEDDPWFKSDWA